jgi:photosystem II stability/assembly factor-like uncharacterized protein
MPKAPADRSNANSHLHIELTPGSSHPTQEHRIPMTAMNTFTRALALGVACAMPSFGLAQQPTQAADMPANATDSRPTDPLLRPALIAPRASRAVTLAVAPAGQRTVAAGERGIVLWSDDGKTWQQAKVPVSVTLTALSFPTPQQGWAVGHGGVILHSTDGGRNWTRQLDGRAAAQIELKAARVSGDPKRVAHAEQLVGDGPDKPFLAVHFWNAKRGFAIGAYGLIFGTEDGGTTWASWSERVQNPKNLHLNAMHVSGGTVFLAGEQGLMLRSVDDAQIFQALQSPYKGSWFAITGNAASVVVAGLRGTVLRSTDAGTTWTPVQVPMPVTIGSALATRDGSLLFANHAGMLLTSVDGGQSLRPLQVPPGPPLTALAEGVSGALLAASFAGPMQLPAHGRSTSARRP